MNLIFCTDVVNEPKGLNGIKKETFNEFFISEGLHPKQFLKKLDCVQKNLHIKTCTKE